MWGAAPGCVGSALLGLARVSISIFRFSAHPAGPMGLGILVLEFESRSYLIFIGCWLPVGCLLIVGRSVGWLVFGRLVGWCLIGLSVWLLLVNLFVA